MIPIVLGLLLFLLFTQPALAASSVVLNEIYPHPPSGSKEWVEIYNSSSQNQTINGFKIKEKILSSGEDMIHDLPNLSLPAQGSCYYEFLTSTGGVAHNLNDTEDTVTLTDNNNVDLDSYHYDTTTQGKSFARVPDGGSWATGLEPSQTINCSTFTIPTEIPTPTPTPTIKITKPPTSSPTIKATATPTKTTASKIVTTISPTQNTTVVLGERTASVEASPSTTTQIYLGGDNQSSQEAKPLVKDSSYSKYLSWGLIILGVLVVGTPIALFLKKKYG